VEEKKFSVFVKIGADMFPFVRKGGFLSSPEQGSGVYGFNAGSIGKAAVSGIGGPQIAGFGVKGFRGVYKNKGIIGGGPDKPIYTETAYRDTVAGQNIFFRPPGQDKARFFRQGPENPGAVFRAGQDMEIRLKGFKGFHNPENKGPAPQRKERFTGKTAGIESPLEHYGGHFPLLSSASSQ
jgi:hypothetical protein